MAIILLIEDEEDIRLNISELLSLAGHSVHTATNGKEGVEMARVIHPDLIISDIMMPYIDGFGVLHILRKEPAVNKIPFIFLTSKNDNDDYRQAIKLGADDYITKPFDAGTLLNAIDNKINKDTGTSADKVGDTDAQNSINELLKYHKDEVARLIEMGEATEFKKKQVIYKEGSIARSLYFVTSGKVKTSRCHDDGKELVLDLFAEGDFVGCASLLAGEYHFETAVAMEDSELISIPRTSFEHYLENTPIVMRKFINILATSVVRKDQQLTGFAYNTLRKKVAEALLAFERKYHKKQEEKFFINIGRDDLASIAGTATESLIRTLGEFKQEKLIEMQNGAISIVNSKRLEFLLH